ncbi:hypothetical protein [Cardinium endosymbiont of Tipula unca]|uniref:hypothetical protein n=1 Tax=Cardinium endosymbiont of Tipula unca TaxID=3066216 RepID=UPI0030CB4B27
MQAKKANTALQSEQDEPKAKQVSKKKEKKSKKSKATKRKRRSCDIIAYTSGCLINPQNLAKYIAFYHQGAHCIGVDVNQIATSEPQNIMWTIYCGRQLKSLSKDQEKATWPLSQRYNTALRRAEFDLNRYNEYKKGQGAIHYTSDPFVAVFSTIIVDSIIIATYGKQDIMFGRMVPYIMGLGSIRKQVKISNVGVMTLATEAPILLEPAAF